ncbi:MAG: hypothetical protein M1832_004275 [Thelocarpon impressellum]|nr:MAG: hypothetical protein M1832_004275 [Thelocarpon impressellum]
MSLNGLDDATVTEAFQAALAEPGGWFLLKYTSRDEVDVLARGSGGVTDLRETVAAYREKSPLYGFLRFRRRNVLVKYVPDGTSRLLQARVPVHLLSITEKFSPHDTVFSITSPEELKETALSAACSLHAASHSTSSSNSSLQRPRLGEIAEDAEENRTSRSFAEKPLPPLPGQDRPSTALTQRDDSIHTKTDGRSSEDTERAIRHAVRTATLPPREPAPADTTAPDGAASALSRRPSTATTHRTSPPGFSEDRRTSSNSVRPSTRDLYNGYSYGLKPKVKLGPRPSLDSGRPQTSGADPRRYEVRPVSTLPAGLRVAPRKTASPAKAKPPPQPIISNVQVTLSPPPTPDVPPPPASAPVTPHGLPSLAPSSSAASIRSVSTARAPALSPEKQRLMKALQLRKKQMGDAASRPSPAEDAPGREEEEEPEAAPVQDASASLVPDGAHDPSPAVPEEANQESQAPRSAPAPAPAKIDDVDSAAATDDASVEDAVLDKSGSSPVSMADSPEPTSTKASSISDESDKQPSDSTERAPTDAMETGDPESEAEESEAKRGVEDDDVNRGEMERTLSQAGPLEDSTQDDPTARDVADADDESLPACGESAGEAAPPSADDLSGAGVSSADAGAVPADSDSSAAAAEDTTPPQDHAKVIQQAQATPLPDDDEAETPVQQAAEAVELSPSIKDKSDFMDHLDEFGPRHAGGTNGSNEEQPSTRDQMSSAVEARQRSGRDSASTCSTSASGSRRASLDEGLSPLKKRRRGLVEPIRTDLSPDDSDDNDNLLSDEALMNELGAATVQEAKPVSVRRSPSSSIFPKRPGDAWIANRSASNPSVPVLTSTRNGASKVESPSDARSRSISGPFVSTNGHKQGPIAMIKKINVSSGISQRIKALEMLSSQTASPVTPPLSAASSPNASPSLAVRRQPSVRAGPTKSVIIPATPKGLASSPLPASLQQQPSERGREPSPIQQPPPQEPHTESISVKARIVKEPGQSYPRNVVTAPDVSDPSTPLELHESPLVIEHHRPTSQSQGSRLRSPKERPLSVLSSSFMPKSDPGSPTSTRRPSIASRNSTSSVSRSEAKSPPASRKSSSSGLAGADEKKEKKESTKSRIFRRMSSISSASRKSLVHAVSPTLKEEETVVETATLVESRRGSVDVGEVNVQFPDSLLWKRRCLRLDSEGYINLTQSKTDEVAPPSPHDAYRQLIRAQFSRAAPKRYHLSEFDPPFAPDQDGQELPNSVILDFRDGGSLQCACEHSAGQERVLSSLVESHRDWAK